MGIRIHKCLGWGYDRLQDHPYFVAQGKVNEAYELTLLQFNKYCLDNKSRIDSMCPPSKGGDLFSFKLAIKGHADKQLGNFMQYDGEFADTNILLLQPFGYKDWSRYDDIIDYCEAGIPIDPSAEPKLQKLRNGIYPFVKGKPPYEIAAMCLWLGLPEMFSKLEEAIYTWWG